MTKSCKVKSQYRNIAKRQKLWSTLALKDSRYSKNRAEEMRNQGKLIEAKDFEREARVGILWGNRRRRIAELTERKAQRMNC